MGLPNCNGIAVGLQWEQWDCNGIASPQWDWQWDRNWHRIGSPVASVGSVESPFGSDGSLGLSIGPDGLKLRFD